MAQADSVPSSTRQLITGEATNQSTNLRAVNLPAVRVQPVDRRYFIDGPDARVIINTDEAPLFWFRRERRPDVELEDLSNCRWYAASQEPLGSNIGALSFETIGFLLGRSRSRNKRLRLSASEGVSSTQLVRSDPQGRLR